MTIEITGTFSDGTHARILHEGNRFKPRTITASAEAASYPGAGADIGDTVDRWRPFENGLSAPATLIGWTATGVTVAADNLTITEQAVTGQHDVSLAYTFTAAETVVAFKVERQTVPQVQVRANDGTTSFTCLFDLRDFTVGTAVNCTGDIVDLGHDQILVRIYFTPAAAAGVVELLLANAAGAVSYTGDTSNSIKFLRASAHESAATLRYDLFTAAAGDCIAVAAHNLWRSGGRIRIEHDSNNDDTWTLIDTLVPVDDSPIMFFFDAITSSRWRINIDRAALPEVGVFRVGAALKMERAFYAGHTITRMNRDTAVVGNLSGSGELLGRSRKRTILRGAYQWQRLSLPWVRANLEGPSGLIQSAEVEPVFIAWRPSAQPDVDYVMRADTTAPANSGQVNLMTFAMSGEVYAYE